jgi:hypothetical protein
MTRLKVGIRRTLGMRLDWAECSSLERAPRYRRHAVRKNPALDIPHDDCARADPCFFPDTKLLNDNGADANPGQATNAYAACQKCARSNVYGILEFAVVLDYRVAIYDCGPAQARARVDDCASTDEAPRAKLDVGGNRGGGMFDRTELKSACLRFACNPQPRTIVTHPQQNVIYSGTPQARQCLGPAEHRALSERLTLAMWVQLVDEAHDLVSAG